MFALHALPDEVNIGRVGFFSHEIGNAGADGARLKHVSEIDYGHHTPASEAQDQVYIAKALPPSRIRSMALIQPKVKHLRE